MLIGTIFQIISFLSIFSNAEYSPFQKGYYPVYKKTTFILGGEMNHNLRKPTALENVTESSLSTPHLPC